MTSVILSKNLQLMDDKPLGVWKKDVKVSKKVKVKRLMCESGKGFSAGGGLGNVRLREHMSYGNLDAPMLRHVLFYVLLEAKA